MSERSVDPAFEINKGAMDLYQEVYRVENISSRFPRLVQELKSFSFGEVAKRVGHLLVRQENHAATLRIEALLHLAALSCGGQRRPRLANLRVWLNAIIDDPIGRMEDPLEDVFVSLVLTDFGNARLLMGRWQGNADYVQTCIAALGALRRGADLRADSRPCAGDPAR